MKEGLTMKKPEGELWLAREQNTGDAMPLDILEVRKALYCRIVLSGNEERTLAA